MNILAAFIRFFQLKIGFYTEGFGPPSYAEAIVCCLAQRWDTPTFRAPARCAKRSLYTEGFGPPSFAPIQSVLPSTKMGDSHLPSSCSLCQTNVTLTFFHCHDNRLWVSGSLPSTINRSLGLVKNLSVGLTLRLTPTIYPTSSNLSHRDAGCCGN